MLEQFDCLATSTDIWGSHFIEASAGTGKTFTIEHVVARALIEDEAIEIDNILIVTFTRAATRDLSLRIRKRLRACIADLERKSSEYEYIKALIDCGEEAINAGLDRLKRALSVFDKAQIFTIHSFCHKMLKSAGIEANVTFGQVDPAENGYEIFAQAQVHDYLRVGLDAKQFSTSQIEKALRFSGGKLDLLTRKLLFLTHKIDSKAAYLTIEDAHHAINSELQKIHTSALQEELCTLAKGFKGLSDRSGNLFSEVNEQIEMWSKVICEKKISLEQLNDVIRSDPNLLLSLNDNNQKKRAASLEFPEWFLQIQKNITPLIQALCDPRHILERMALGCKDRLEKAEQCHDIHPPDGALHMMHQALSKEGFCKKVKEKYAVAIIDEFQDTDALQWQIFERLFSENMKAFYVVGDPKQSIYAFRNADLYTYLHARKTFGEKGHQGLLTNYRSSKRLMTGLNALFSRGESWLTLPKLNSSIEYRSGLSPDTVETCQFKDEKQGVHLWLCDVKAGRSLPSKEMEQTQLFPLIAQEIYSSGLDLSAYAVLVKDRYQAMRLQAYFKRINIPSTSKSGVSVLKTKAAALMDSLLSAILNPRKLPLIKRLLSSPIITWPYFDLMENEFSINMQTVAAKLFALQRQWYEYGLSGVLESVLTYGFGTSKTLLEHLTLEDQAQDYIDWMQLCELLLEQDEKKPQDLYRYFCELKTRNPDQCLAIKQRENTTCAGVRIMTTHMSKGLEFDVVVALGVASRHTPDAGLDSMALNELDAEKMRLFYVALTRAKQRVYVPVILTPEKGALPGASSAVEQFFGRFGNSSDEIVNALMEEPSISMEKIESTYDVKPLEILDQPQIEKPKEHALHYQSKTISSYSSLVKGQEKPHRRIDQERSGLSLHSMPAGAHIGTLLHDLLERILCEKLHRLDQVKRLEKLIHSVLSKGPLENWTDVVTNAFKQLFKVDLGGFSLLDVDQLMMETEFLFSVDNKLAIRGFADLIFNFQGKVYIVDWKTNLLGIDSSAYKEEHLKVAMSEHDYFLQARIYAAALTKWWRNFDERPPQEFFGGAYYVFLRGLDCEETHGIYHFQPLGEDL